MDNSTSSSLLNKETFLSKISYAFYKVHDTGRYYGMEMNVEKNESNENFKTTIPSNNYGRPKTTGECEMF